MDIILKLLDWPVLLFVGLGLLVMNFGEEIRELIKRGGVTITWGNNSFSIDQLPEQLDENFAPLDDDIKTLQERVARLESGSGLPLLSTVRLADSLYETPLESPSGLMGEGGGAAGFTRPTDDDGEVRLGGLNLTEDDDASPKVDDDKARQRMLVALGEGKYRWRSLDRLATVAGVSTVKADALLRAMPDQVAMGTGKQGRPLARLRSK